MSLNTSPTVGILHHYTCKFQYFIVIYSNDGLSGYTIVDSRSTGIFMYVDDIRKWHNLQSEKSRDDVDVDDAIGSWGD